MPLQFFHAPAHVQRRKHVHVGCGICRERIDERAIPVEEDAFGILILFFRHRCAREKLKQRGTNPAPEIQNNMNQTESMKQSDRKEAPDPVNRENLPVNRRGRFNYLPLAASGLELEPQRELCFTWIAHTFTQEAVKVE